MERCTAPKCGLRVMRISGVYRAKFCDPTTYAASLIRLVTAHPGGGGGVDVKAPPADGGTRTCALESSEDKMRKPISQELGFGDTI